MKKYLVLKKVVLVTLVVLVILLVFVILLPTPEIQDNVNVNDSKEIVIPKNDTIKDLLMIKDITRLYKEDKEKVLNFRKDLDNHIKITDELLSGKVESNCKNVWERRKFLIPPDHAEILKIENIHEAMHTGLGFSFIAYNSYSSTWHKLGREYKKRCGKKWNK